MNKKNNYPKNRKPYSEETKKKMSEIAKKKGFGKWMKDKKISKERKKKMVEGVKNYYKNSDNRKKLSLVMKVKSVKGEKHYRWKGGITNKNRKIRYSFEWKEWRKSVFERDNYTCQMCGKRGSIELHPHHIFKFSDYLKLRFLTENGITLCVNCHHITIGKENLFINLFLTKIKNESNKN